MEHSVVRLSEFVCGLTFESLPKEVIEFTKRLLLDTVGCGVAGMTSDKGKWGIDFARRCFGNGGNAVVLGYGDTMTPMGAAFVNAELINGLDYEAAGLHLPPFVLPPVMALAEAYGRSGKDVITATAAALEVGTRIAEGLKAKKPEPGSKSGIAPVFGPCSSVFGGAAGASKIMGLGAEKTAHAMGLSGVLSPVPSQASMHRDLPVNSGKYLMAGWAAQTGLTAAELAKSGHRGNLQVLDSEYGYWRFTGQAEWDRKKALDGLGEEWHFLQSTPYKQFPCCGMMHGGLECLRALLEENGIKPEEIEKIQILLDPSSAEAMFHVTELENQIDLQFSVAYNMAVLALGIRPGIRWQESSLKKDPAVLSMMKKVSSGVHPECAKAQEENPRNRVVSAEVTARGTVFKKELRYVKGTVTAGALMEVPEEMLVEKFMENTSLILSETRAEEAKNVWLRLDEEADFSRAMGLLHP